MSKILHRAPPGFTREQWEFFDREGYLHIEDALSQDEIQMYIQATDRVAALDPGYDPMKGFFPWGMIAHKDPLFTELIDHPRHVGFAYDLYGELLKLHNSQAFIRPAQCPSPTRWHPDGARAVPYGVYVPRLPIQMKVSYWLTDLPEDNMGNMVIFPGSHRQQIFEGYTKKIPPKAGEVPICVKKGTMTLLHCGLFHYVRDNETDKARYNIFYTYCPSWVCEADRVTCDLDWAKGLSREQRIIMRPYTFGYDRTKPPKEDFPLYLDRETGLDHDEDADLEVPLEVRKRKLPIEKWL